MVTAQNEEVLWVLDLVCQKKADGLEGLLATIDVITEEEVVCFRRETTVLEQAQKVVVLSVDVTTDLQAFVSLSLIIVEIVSKCMDLPLWEPQARAELAEK